MTLFADLADICRCEEPLAPRTWFRIGGPAEYFLQPRTDAQLATIIRRCHESGTPVRFLGLGANVLVSDRGVRGAVVHLGDPHFNAMEFDGDTALVGAGADMTKLVLAAVRGGAAGLEQLAGIPGSVGGGIAMNCGGRYGDISSAVQTVTGITPRGEIVERAAAELDFGYRHSSLGDDCAVRVRFALRREDPAELNRRFREIWDYKKATQPPLGDASVGCIFRNPPGQSAGLLIDRAGLKGEQFGTAYVSDRHANFILSRAGGRAADVLALIGQIRRRVRDHAGIILQPEVRIWADEEEYEQADWNLADRSAAMAAAPAADA